MNKDTIGSNELLNNHKQLLKIMRITLFLLLFGVLVSQASNSFSQETKLTITLKSTTIKEVCEVIGNNSKYSFVFSGSANKLSNKQVDINANAQDIEQILDNLLSGTKLAYRILDKQIVIYEDKTIATQNDSNEVSSIKSTQKRKRKISGVIIDKDGVSVIGANILERDTQNGTISDLDGKFTLDVADDAVLKISYIGYLEKIVNTKGKDSFRIVLLEDTQALDEVVINGLFVHNKNSYTGAVTTLSGDDLLEISSTDLFKAISTLVPGARVVENNEMGSNPNQVPEIIIRGMSSIASQGEYGLNNPLIILDGVEISIVQLYDLDINEIERLDVLKDASATSMYGEKAANGVIVIERKKVLESKIRVRYNIVPTFEFPDITSYNYTNAAQKLELEKLAGLYNSADGSLDESYNSKFKLIQRGVETNWMAKPLRNTTSLNHSLSMTGRGGGMDFGITASFANKLGVMKGDYRNNYSVGFYFSYRLVNKFTLTYRSNINKTDTKVSPYGSFSNFVILNPYDTPYNEYGEWNKLLSYNFRNPLYDATTSSFDKSENKSITNNLSGRWDIVKGFYATGSISHTLSDSGSDRFVSPEHSSFETETDPGKRGRYDVTNMRSQNWQARVGLSYSKALSDNGSVLTLNIGANANKNNSNNNSFTGIGFLKGNLTDLAFANSYPLNGRPSGRESLNASVGAYGNANIIFFNKYFIDGSYRVSGSSKFGKDRRFAPFWSLGIGWNAHNEPFIKDLSIFDILRFRGSFGYTGSVNFSDYQAVTTYRYSQDNNYLVGMGALPITMGNDDLKWQTTIKFNTGLTAEMIDGRLSLNFDIYKDNTTDLLLAISTPPSVGVRNVMSNLGETSNWGYEWAVSGMIVKRRNLYWRLGISGYHTENKLNKISNSLQRQNDSAMKDLGVAAPKLQLEEGKSASAIYSVPSLGIDPATGKEVFIKKDGTHTFNYDVKDKVALGNSMPYFQGALTTSAGYKGFSVSSAVSFTFGGDIYNSTRASKVERIDPKQNVDVRAFTERWKKPGDIVAYTAITENKGYVHTQRFIERKNEVYLSSINFSYEINPKLVRKFGLSRLSIGVGFSDVLRISTVEYERGTSYPYAKGYNFRISPTF